MSEYNTCSKKQFSTGQEANERANEIMNEVANSGGKQYMRPYKCEVCGMYHLTSKRKSDYKKKRKKTVDEITKIRQDRFIERESEFFIKKFKI